MNDVSDIQKEMIKTEWVIDSHKHKKSYIECRTIDPEHFAYRSKHHPLQICITAGGWKAKVLKFIFRIPDCKFTGTDVRYWPHDELMK